MLESPKLQHFYWGYLIEERVDGFVIEIYIKVNISINTGIVYADPDQYFSSVTSQ